MTTSEIIQHEREIRIKEKENDTFNIIKKIYNKEISIGDKSIRAGLVNGLIKYSSFLDMSIEDYVDILVNEYELGSLMARNVVQSLIIDPLRQNLSEEIQKKQLIEKNFKIADLSQSGKNSLLVYNGKVKKSGSLTKGQRNKASKALDFKVSYDDNVEFYTYNKYNKWVGGSTDDVFKDVVRLIESIKKLEDKSIKFVIILDGNYWDINIKKLLSKSENLIITNTDKLDKELLESKGWI